MDVSIGKSRLGSTYPTSPVPCGAWTVIGVSALLGAQEGGSKMSREAMLKVLLV
jgi:hypothetical protein